jgi:hypothetical protein
MLWGYPVESPLRQVRTFIGHNSCSQCVGSWSHIDDYKVSSGATMASTPPLMVAPASKHQCIDKVYSGTFDTKVRVSVDSTSCSHCCIRKGFSLPVVYPRIGNKPGHVRYFHLHAMGLPPFKPEWTLRRNHRMDCVPLAKGSSRYACDGEILILIGIKT